MNDVVEALRSLEGVVDVDLDDRPDGSLSVRIAVSQDANEGEIASLARRILELHGLSAPPVVGEGRPGRRGMPGPGRPGGGAPAPPPLPSIARRSLEAVSSVSVTEHGDGAVVEVAGGGRTITRAVAGAPGAVRDEVARAAAQLVAGKGPVRAMVGCSVYETGGHRVATVVFEDGSGSLLVGSALVRAGEPMAIARAVLRALQ